MSSASKSTVIDDSVFYRAYDYDHYNCFHFACEMIGRIQAGPAPDPEAIIAAVREKPGRSLKAGVFGEADEAERTGKSGRGGGFRRVGQPAEGSLCLFQNPSGEETHTGVFYQGRVLHIQENGVKFQPLHIVLLQFRRVSFYDYLDHN
ncbi:MAG: hypothetical protein LBV80_10900 [Deltaproteobacteria bacterium]|jgi:hypothetical protein|nr:hypothetical protein [Deltaproteobacteria bacterium]